MLISLLLVGRPLDADGGAIDAQHNQLGLPGAAVVAPHVRVLVGATGDDAVGVRGPVDAQHFGRVLVKCLRQLPAAAARFRVD